MYEVSQTPANMTERIIALDVLRGFALFGILYCHIIWWYSADAVPQSLVNQLSIADSIARSLYGALFTAKFFSIFSFLFGMSFFIQLEALARKGDNPALRFAWRLLILAAIGVVHNFFWRADILSIYAALGLLLIFCRKASNKTLLIVGSILALNIPTLLIQLFLLITTGNYSFFDNNLEAQGIHYLNIVQHGSLIDIIADNYHGTRAKLEYQIESGRMIMTFGFFLLGMLVARIGWLQDIERYRKSFTGIWRTSCKIILALLLMGIAIRVTFKVLGIELTNNLNAQYVFIFLKNFFNAATTVFYISSIVLLITKPRWAKLLLPLAYIGKMALTSYIVQTIVGVGLFFGIGFGLFGKTSLAENIGISIIIFGLQIVFSRWWLQRFYYGPIEWLWRSATFFKWQKFVKP